jgi:hypothetical protein
LLCVHGKQACGLCVFVAFGLDVREEFGLFHPGEVDLAFEAEVECIVAVEECVGFELLDLFHELEVVFGCLLFVVVGLFEGLEKLLELVGVAELFWTWDVLHHF